MATKVVKVKAHKRLDGTGKVEDVNAHLRKLNNAAVKIYANEKTFLNMGSPKGHGQVVKLSRGMGWESNFSPYLSSEILGDGQRDILPTKTAAKKLLMKRLT